MPHIRSVEEKHKAPLRPNFTNRLEGATFDVLLEGGQTWQCNYLACRREGDDLWLIPANTQGPFFRLSEKRLDTFQGAPYESGYQRYAGIIRATETSSFEGRF